MGVLPRVVIDARMVGGVGHGIAHYVQDLALGLAKLRENRRLAYDVIFLVDENRRKQVSLANFGTFDVSAPFLDPRENLEIAETLTSLRADLYHSPSFSSPLFCPCPTVQTIHDLNHLHFGSIATKLYYHWMLKPFARKARHLMTVSEFSRREIAAWLKISEDDITVVKNAIRPEMLSKASSGSVGLLREHEIREKQYLFTLASGKSHKNLRTLVRAYKNYRERMGAKAWPLVLPTSGKQKPMSGLLELGPLDTPNAMMLLKNAGAFFFPSLYEGFGRPPLEAACLGVPVVASAIAPHEEGLAGVAKSEYRLISPTDASAWVEAMVDATEGRLSAPGEAAKKWITENHSISHLAETMDAIYVSNIRRF